MRHQPRFSGMAPRPPTRGSAISKISVSSAPVSGSTCHRAKRWWSSVSPVATRRRICSRPRPRRSCFGVDADGVAKIAPTLEPAPHRGRIHKLASGITLVDDSYNASPVAMRRLLEMLAAGPGRRVAVLGEMYELGEHSAEAHRRVGGTAAASCDLLVATGGADAAELAGAARAAGMNPDAVHHVADAEAAAESARFGPRARRRRTGQGFARGRPRPDRRCPAGLGGCLMLYALLTSLSDTWFGFNVFRYITFRAGSGDLDRLFHQPRRRPVAHRAHAVARRSASRSAKRARNTTRSRPGPRPWVGFSSSAVSC